AFEAPKCELPALNSSDRRSAAGGRKPLLNEVSDQLLDNDERRVLRNKTLRCSSPPLFRQQRYQAHQLCCGMKPLRVVEFTFARLLAKRRGESARRWANGLETFFSFKRQVRPAQQPSHGFSLLKHQEVILGDFIESPRVMAHASSMERGAQK